MVKRLIPVVVAVAAVACGPRVQPIDLHDETIPIDARRLVADAEDSIEIAHAQLDEARRELQRTIEWKEDLLERDWPSKASSAISELETMASARVELEELEVERAEEHIDVAEAKFDLITAKTAIRHDLAIYELAPLRKILRREEKDVEELEGKITAMREKLAQKVDKWWASYKSYAGQGGNTRLLYVSAAREAKRRKLREPSEEEKEKGGDGSDDTEATPNLSEMVDQELEKELEEGESEESDEESKEDGASSDSEKNGDEEENSEEK